MTKSTKTISEKKPTIQTITFHGRRWFDKAWGNTYNTCEIRINGEFVHKTKMQYGYGSHYETIGFAWLVANDICEIEKYESGGLKWREYLQGAKIIFESFASDGLKREL